MITGRGRLLLLNNELAAGKAGEADALEALRRATGLVRETDLCGDGCR
ncbi:MAG: hypothetical protein KAF42_07580 [Sphingopyxis terrae]|nr:hypothetical protein [Sphingopyxis terrae]